MALKDWKLYKTTKNHRKIIIGKVWVRKTDRNTQLNLISVMPYAHVLHFSGWRGIGLGTFRTFKEGENAAKIYMKAN